MSCSSEARRSFAVESLGEKSVSDLAGVCDALADRLKSVGFDKVIDTIRAYCRIKIIQRTRLCLLFCFVFLFVSKYVFISSKENMCNIVSGYGHWPSHSPTKGKKQ